MTREQLFNLICDIHPCVGFNLFFNKWLDEYDKQIRADAIDEFVHEVKEHHYVLHIEQIADELKEQNK